jgi:hypothetical protein
MINSVLIDNVRYKVSTMIRVAQQQLSRIIESLCMTEVKDGKFCLSSFCSFSECVEYMEKCYDLRRIKVSYSVLITGDKI